VLDGDSTPPRKGAQVAQAAQRTVEQPPPLGPCLLSQQLLSGCKDFQWVFKYLNSAKVHTQHRSDVVTNVLREVGRC